MIKTQTLPKKSTTVPKTPEPISKEYETEYFDFDIVKLEGTQL